MIHDSGLFDDGANLIRNLKAILPLTILTEQWLEEGQEQYGIKT